MRIQVNARNRGFEFDARAREPVLYAGLRAGIDLPYECATGTCGTCKAKLISGRLHDGWREAPGRKHVKPEQREFLMCQCAREGERLETFGPLGKATFDPALAKNLLCIAGGSGIAGMMSILSRAARERYFDRYRGWVFFGVRMMRDAFFLGELSAFRAQGLEITVALSDEDVPASARSEWPQLGFAPRLVHEVARRTMAGKYHDMRAYVAGPPAAVDAAIRMLLLEARLTTDNIRYDKFS